MERETSIRMDEINLRSSKCPAAVECRNVCAGDSRTIEFIQSISSQLSAVQ